MADERRSSRRIPKKLPVAFKQVGRSDESFDDVVQNVSAGGVFINSSAKPEVGTELELEIGKHEPGCPTVQLKAEVVRLEEAGFAVKFIDSDPEELMTLLTMVVQETSDLPEME